MLTKLRVENFKSFNEPATLNLAPLTLLAGANSSGKTTVIQSILLLKQTVQYAPVNTAVALNGPLLKLGDFRDIRNIANSSSAVRIAFELSHGPAEAQMFPFYIGSSGEKSISRTDIACDVEFHVPEGGLLPTSQLDLANLHPQLKSARVELSQHLKPSEKGPSVLQYHLVIDSTGTKDSEAFALAADAPSPTLGRGKFAIRRIDSDTQIQAVDSRADGHVVGANVSHFLPDEFIVEYDEAKEIAKRVAQRIAEASMRSTKGTREIDSVLIPPSVIYLIRDFLESERGDERHEAIFMPDYDGAAIKVADFVALIQRFDLDAFRGFRGIIHKSAGASSSRYQTALGRIGTDLRPIQAAIQNQLETEFGSKSTTTRVGAPNFSECATSIRYWLSYWVKYLGPLRDEPKPAYPLEALDNPGEVGYRGEHTAAVFHLFRDEQVTYVPASFVEEPNLSPKVKSSTLYHAVIDWLVYLGVADDVTAGDQGKFGHTLQVSAPGIRKLHDLTNVGVGVSQVLPIVIQTLLSSPGTLLIFEQPELHLHPKVQARLGDFFLAMALHGKQCILETHSEYLIDRVRRRIAEASDENFNSSVEIYFLERGDDGTRCNRVRVTEFGALPEWPRDFFDQSDEESEAIVGAATRKRQRRQKQTSIHAKEK